MFKYNLEPKSLLQVPARAWLHRLFGSQAIAKTLADIPESELTSLRESGFEWLYLLGVWQTGTFGQDISRTNPAWNAGYRAAISDIEPDDISGSPFAVSEYRVHWDFGGNAALADLRRRLASHGLKLMLDFVPNHLAIDHSWIRQHPQRFIQGNERDLAREPMNYFRVDSDAAIFAHGRDPYFPGWADTVQLDYSNREVAEAMAEELSTIADQCDGVRCDMAMLLLPAVFERTWGRKSEPFWPAAIARARSVNSDFAFLAEVYWDLEWELQQQGFDFCYDKRLYDRVLGGDSTAVRQHLAAPVAYQSKLARFLENHDEPRIAAELTFERHTAAAILTYTTPGLRFFHEGQLSGFRRRPSIHLRRRQAEAIDPEIASFYQRLISFLRSGAAQGDWQLLDVRPAWEFNRTDRNFICFMWSQGRELCELMAVNFSADRSQCLLPLPADSVGSGRLTLRDQFSGAMYERLGEEITSRGLYVDLPPWGAHVLRVC